MITIEKCSEYNVRVMKNPDFDNMICGFNFSYPVMNSIEIASLLISGGTIEIKPNGQAASQWSFDKETSALSIKQKDKEQKIYIADISELGKAMMEYWDKNKDDILKQTLDTNLKKSQSKIGNQNAKKDVKEDVHSYETPRPNCRDMIPDVIPNIVQPPRNWRDFE